MGTLERGAVSVPKRMGAEFLGPFWLVLGVCGRAVLAVGASGRLRFGWRGMSIPAIEKASSGSPGKPSADDLRAEAECGGGLRVRLPVGYVLL
jgi:hypothetical protein